MQIWDETSGEVRLSDSARLFAHMSRAELDQACSAISGDSAPAGDPSTDEIVPFPAFEAPGGRLACVCYLHGGRLHAVELWVAGVGQRKRGTADQQRALLFQCLRAGDPARDSKRGVLLRCPFGTALIATDPRTGDATLRLTYR